MKTDFRKSVIYQIYLRTFTAEGTLEAAEKLIPHLAELGIDIIYMSACNKEDDSVEGQSSRQIASGMNNTKNPYRISDYFDIDEEYGTMDDLRSFVDTAHRYGMKVLIDLVYLHCGSNAVFIEEHPEFVIRDENGEIKIGETWPFARFNYEVPELREYLRSNMEFYIRDIKADGFRCDVGDCVPIDFWAESTKRIREINPDAIMLNEGSDPKLLSVFDINYGFPTIYGINNLFLDTEDIANDKEIAGREPMTVESYKKLMTDTLAATPEGRFLLLNSENHDTASDLADRRLEVGLGFEAAEAVMAILFTLKGIPMIYNGSEVADTAPKSMFWNRFSPGGMSVQWQNVLTDKGQCRLKTVKELIRLHRHNDAIVSGDLVWSENECGDNVLCFERRTENKSVLVIVNVGKKKQTAVLGGKKSGKVIFARNAKTEGDQAILDAYGVLIIE